jgi:hypothetical protein
VVDKYKAASDVANSTLPTCVVWIPPGFSHSIFSRINLVLFESSLKLCETKWIWISCVCSGNFSLIPTVS